MAIIKILSRSKPSYTTLIDYITRGSIDSIITCNLRKRDKKGIIDEYLQNEAFRKSNRINQTYLYHEIISFSNEEPSDKLTPQVIRKLADKYIALRGSDSVVIGAVHRDKNHIHIHFAVSGLKYRTGKSVRMSKSELLKLKQDFQKYHNQELGISKSNPEHGKSMLFLNDKERYAIIKDSRIKKREELRDTIQVCLNKANSKREFFDMLLDKDLPYYERAGVPVGLISNEKKYRLSSFEIDRLKYESLEDDNKEINKSLLEIEKIRNKNIAEKNIDKTL